MALGVFPFNRRKLQELVRNGEKKKEGVLPDGEEYIEGANLASGNTRKIWACSVEAIDDWYKRKNVTVKSKELVKPKKENLIIPEYLNTPSFIEAWDYYVDNRTKMKAKMTHRAKELALKKLSKYPVDVAIEALELSVENGWKGVFPESVMRERKRNNKNRSFGVVDISNL